MALTRRQKEVLELIAGFVEENGYSPSYEEIASGLGLASLATVHKHIRALEGKGYLRCGHNQSRSLDLAFRYLQERRRRRGGAGGLEVPLAGRIAAGSPVESVPGRETLDFAEFLRGGEAFALEVRGDSMIEDHICDGDYVLVERVGRVQDGDIVVALVQGMETTLKRFYHEVGDRARLQPANSSMDAIIVPLADLQIQGRVLAVLRKYR
jgi:repressor LexA